MKNKVQVKIKTNSFSKVLLKLNQLNIFMQDITYQKEAIVFTTSYEDVKRMKKYMPSYPVLVIEELGIKKAKKILKRNSLFLTSIVLGIILFLFLTRIIVQVNVIHDDKKLRELLTEVLRDKGVYNLSFKKSYDDYEKIISEIKNEYKDKIEWLEIDVKGMIIDVRVEERIIKDYEKENSTCHIVAEKSGIIKDILTKKGVSVVQIQDFVEKGDILISGEVKVGEEVKSNVCAEGSVYAEVWYQVNATVPLEYETVSKTGKMRYNLMMKTDQKESVIFRSRVGEKEVENQKLFSILGSKFYLQREYEVIKSKNTYSESEAIKKALELISEKLDIKLNEFESIIDKKVLKKSINNGNLYIDMFVAVREQIGIKEYYQVEESGTSDQGDNSNR